MPALSPFQSLQAPVDTAGLQPDGLKWAHNDRGGTFRVMGQTFLNNTNTIATDVPIKGGAKSRAAILGNQVDFSVLGIQQSSGFDEQMRVLAIFSQLLRGYYYRPRCYPHSHSGAVVV